MIAAVLGVEAVVANIGVPSMELYAARDRDLNFYMIGATPRRHRSPWACAWNRRDVVVLDGDGSLLGPPFLPWWRSGDGEPHDRLPGQRAFGAGDL